MGPSNKYVDGLIFVRRRRTRAIFRLSKPEKPQHTWRKIGFSKEHFKGERNAKRAMLDNFIFLSLQRAAYWVVLLSFLRHKTEISRKRFY